MHNCSSEDAFGVCVVSCELLGFLFDLMSIEARQKLWEKIKGGCVFDL